MLAEHLLNCQCALGEGPLWFEGRLYWFDIAAHQLHACDEQGGNHSCRTFGEPFSAAAAAGPGVLLLASASGLWRFDAGTGALTHLMGLEADNPATRSNDGRADRRGGFWIGTMGRALEPAAGALYRFHGGKLVKLLDAVTIPNSLCFSPDGRLAYFADSVTAKIMRWPLDDAGWPVGAPSQFADVSDGGGIPDGSIVDRDGCLWNAQWGASRLVRYRPDGVVDRVVSLPVSQPTCVAFGGADLQSLFVTSAREGLEGERIEAEPQAGDLFRIQLAGAGMAEGEVAL